MLKFLVGLGCGIGLGLLVAPAAGSETREQLLDTLEERGVPLRDSVEQVKQIGREKLSDLRDKAGDLGLPVGATEQREDLGDVTIYRKERRA